MSSVSTAAPPGTADASAPDGEAGRITRQLTDFLAGKPDGAGRVTNVRRAGSGRSRDNWLFDLVGPAGTEELILRTDPDGGLIDTDRAVEFEVLRGLAGSGLPTPTARWLDTTGEPFGRPGLIMGRLPGRCDYRVLRDPARPTAEKRELAAAFCDLLAAVHGVDHRALGLDRTLPDPGPAAARAELDRWTAVLRQDQLEPWPELDYAAAVLAEKAPECAARVLVHADFKPGNILVDAGRVSALLDWELAHLGDPLEDLGWVTQPLRSAEHTIENDWTAEHLIAHYEQATGITTDRAALAWWVAFSSYKTAVMQVSGLRAFLEGRADEPYRPTRRVLATLLDATGEPA
ncbi:phosphotransferase [Nakamurella sp. YIM 132087]|uniref:Phosphotransferase n=1 Tax=Nakamurella alba TaxID=2665158 RepID=A0A7K1FL05_9ACTN|nr:phosphotransferase family protein [Nakamurella alba]MTD14832.1 phosphotransferase [Nakamurella alba]